MVSNPAMDLYIHYSIRRTSRTELVMQLTKSPRAAFRNGKFDPNATKFTNRGTFYLEGEQNYSYSRLSTPRTYDGSISQYYAVSVTANQLRDAGFTPSRTNPVQLRFWLLSDNDPNSWKISAPAYVYFMC